MVQNDRTWRKLKIVLRQQREILGLAGRLDDEGRSNLSPVGSGKKTKGEKESGQEAQVAHCYGSGRAQAEKGKTLV